MPLLFILIKEKQVITTNPLVYSTSFHTIRFCLALAACRPPELLRGLKSLGPPTLNSENLLLTTR